MTARSLMLYGATGLLWGFFLYAAGLELSQWTTWVIALWPSALSGVTRGVTMAELAESNNGE